MNHNRNLFAVLLLTGTIAFTACSRKPETKTGETTKDETAKTEVSQDEILLTDAQMKAVDIELGTIEQRNLESVVRASGQLAVPPQNKAELNVLFGGIVRSISVVEGQPVRKGQVLARLENPDFIKLQQEYLATRNGFTYTQAEYRRQQELKAADAGTGKVYQQAEAAYNAERSKLQGIERQLEQLGISPATVARGTISREVVLTAPISGTIGHIGTNTGGYASPGTSLMEIVDNSTIHCDLTVYEADLYKIRNGQSVRFSLTNNPSLEFYGEVYGINKSFEDASKGITVHCIIKGANKQGLISGMYVTALIAVGNQKTPAVPVDAVVSSEGRKYVFVLKENQEAENRGTEFHFKKSEVATGVTELGYVQITPVDTLVPGVKIVTKGAFYILSKSKGGAEAD